MLQFLKSVILAHRELKAEQIVQVLKASMAVHTYVLKDSQVQELFF